MLVTLSPENPHDSGVLAPPRPLSVAACDALCWRVCDQSVTKVYVKPVAAFDDEIERAKAHRRRLAEGVEILHEAARRSVELQIEAGREPVQVDEYPTGETLRVFVVAEWEDPRPRGTWWNRYYATSDGALYKDRFGGEEWQISALGARHSLERLRLQGSAPPSELPRRIAAYLVDHGFV